MKSVCPEVEIAAIKASFKVVGVYLVKVPFLEAERHVMELVQYLSNVGSKTLAALIVGAKCCKRVGFYIKC